MRNGTTELLSVIKKPLSEEPRSCACGCGEVFASMRSRKTRPQTFIFGHRSKLPRKAVVRVLSNPRRQALYAAAGYKCQQCGLTMDEQIARFGRRLEIHHKNHDHEDNTTGNHEVLCTKCHNRESVSVRDEVKKSRTWREHYEAGLIHMWSTDLTKETDVRVAAMAEKKRGSIPWNKNMFG